MILVVMGVSGSGKTTVAAILARRLGWLLEEGDNLHPAANITRMRAGRRLTDEDRAVWLDSIATWIDARLDASEDGIITCSALKRRYRDVINRRGQGVLFIFLEASKAKIAERLGTRQGHFMPAGLLASQFDDLEPPTTEEPSLTVDAGPPPEVIAQEIIDRLVLQRAV